MSQQTLTGRSAQALSLPSAQAGVDELPAQLCGRVLVAEDNPVNQQVAAAMLESLGLHCSLADNGRRAIERLQQGTFDLVLMDCQMPDMDCLLYTSRCV